VEQARKSFSEEKKIELLINKGDCVNIEAETIKMRCYAEIVIMISSPS
jgi:hypothetical protein